MKYRFKPTRRFWESFYELTSQQQDAARRAWQIFKENPFDPRLRPHKSHRLSAHCGRTIHAIEIQGDLRATFYVEGDWIVTVDIGTHGIYG